MTIYDDESSFSAVEGCLLSKNSTLFGHITEGRRRGHCYTSTTVCDRHHGWTVVLVGTEFSALLLLHRRSISGASRGGQYTLKWGQMLGQMIQIPANTIKQSYPSIKRE